MIIRRFTQHIKEQNWFAVGLDVIVVIVGIFLGLQVNEWNEKRILDQESDEFIELLKDDIDVAIEAAQSRYETQMKRFSNGMLFLDNYKSAKSKDDLTPEQIDGLRYITFFTVPDIQIGNLGRALSNDGSSIIRDRKIRQELIKFQRTFGRIDQVYDRIIERIRVTEPVLNKYRAMLVTRTSDANEDEVIPLKFDLKNIQQSEEFEYAFQNALWGHRGGVVWGQFTVEKLTELKEVLQ